MLSVSRRCCAPSCRSRSSCRRCASAVATSRARETQPFELGAPRSVQALVLDRESSGRGDLLREPRVVEQAAAVHEHGDLAASGHHARGDAVGITWQGRRLALRVDPARLTVEAVEQPQRGVAESVRKLALETARRR